MANLPLIEVSAVDYGSEQVAMVRYREDGTRRAMALGNRGPIRFDAQGRLDAQIRDAYSRCGFYVFEGVLQADELADIERDVADMLDRAPVTRGAALDRRGRPALGADCRRAERQLGAAAGRSARRHGARERPASGEDVRAGRAGRGARRRWCS